MLPLIVGCSLAGLGCWLNLPLHADSRVRWLGYGLIALPLGALLGWLVTAPDFGATDRSVGQGILIFAGLTAVVAGGAAVLVPDLRTACRSFGIASAAVVVVLGLHATVLPAVVILAATVAAVWAVRHVARTEAAAVDDADHVHEPLLACVAAVGMAVAFLFAIGHAPAAASTRSTLVFGAVLFALGTLGLLARRNLAIRTLAAGLSIQGIALSLATVERVSPARAAASSAVWILIVLFVLLGSVGGLTLLLQRAEEAEVASSGDDDQGPEGTLPGGVSALTSSAGSDRDMEPRRP